MRDNFPEPIKRILAARAGHLCSRADCRAATSGPQAEGSGVLNVGVAAHITAAAPNGPRYADELKPEERASADNGIWLCQNCAKLVDNDQQRFTADLLRAWKLAAERRAADRIGKTGEVSEEGRNARARFRNALAGAVADIKSDKVDPFHVLSTSRRAHDQAIVEFRDYVHDDLLDQFDETVKWFERVRESAQPALIRFYEQQVTGESTGTTRDEILAAIQQLVTFARR